MQLTVAHDMESLQQALAALIMQGKRTALVPTMGALHQGHMSLIEQAKEDSDAVIVSIFVNPRQFGPNEDFARYPRTLQADLQRADEAGAAIVYAPTPEDIYPPDFSTSVSVGPLAQLLCGASRPGHFDGVATIVTKLLLRTMPHVALFGEKDYQQLCIIRRLAVDLDLPVDIVGVPTFREEDGLAMSSRNAYLTPQERAVAPALHRILDQTADAIQSGVAPVASALEQGIAALTHAGFKVDYLELRDADTLAALDRLDGPARLLGAAWLGQTRLIDNIALE